MTGVEGKTDYSGMKYFPRRDGRQSIRPKGQTQSMCLYIQNKTSILLYENKTKGKGVSKKNCF